MNIHDKVQSKSFIVMSKNHEDPLEPVTRIPKVFVGIVSKLEADSRCRSGIKVTWITADGAQFSCCQSLLEVIG